MAAIDVRKQLRAEGFNPVSTGPFEDVFAYRIEISVEKLIARISTYLEGRPVYPPPDTPTAARDNRAGYQTVAFTSEHL